jgi:hypothetical protein
MEWTTESSSHVAMSPCPKNEMRQQVHEPSRGAAMARQLCLPGFQYRLSRSTFTAGHPLQRQGPAVPPAAHGLRMLWLGRLPARRQVLAGSISWGDAGAAGKIAILPSWHDALNPAALQPL